LDDESDHRGHIPPGDVPLNGGLGRHTNGTALVALFFCVLALYYSTAPRDRWASDPLFHALTAQQLATDGSVFLADQAYLTDPLADLAGSWIMTGPGGLVSIYPPGTALIAAPAYALAAGRATTLLAVQVTEETALVVRAPPLTPATIMSAATTAMAVAATFLLLRHAGGSSKEAFAGALVFAFATGAWSVSSQRLWAHGPAMMWLALGMWWRQTRHNNLSGLTEIAVVITRPTTAVIGATRAFRRVVRTRRLQPALPEIAWLAIGVLILTAYNMAIVGSDPIFGGYATVSSVRITNPDVRWWISNIGGSLFDPSRGLLTVSPFIICLLPGIRSAWRSADAWIKDAALGGLCYFLLHNLAHNFVGGDGYFGYRYPLEALVVAGPLLFSSYLAWAKGHRFRVVVLLVGIAVSAALQAFGVANQFE
jgi:hypothetical protein